MKGKQLTLQEVLDLEDGSKVWVEDKEDKELSGVHIVDDKALVNHERKKAYDFSDLEFFKDELEFYEWIEELKIPDKIETPYYSENIINKMSVEICNLRGLDLTDENIRLTVEEFS